MLGRGGQGFRAHHSTPLLTKFPSNVITVVVRSGRFRAEWSGLPERYSGKGI